MTNDNGVAADMTEREKTAPISKAEKLSRAMENVMSGGREFNRQLAAQVRDELRRLDRERMAVNEFLIEARNLIAERRNVQKPGPLFAAYNEAMGDVETVRFKLAARAEDRP